VRPNKRDGENIAKLNIEQASRAAVLCFLTNVPIVLWGEPGIGKSAIVEQIADRLGREMYDVRSSNKERSDFSIPYPAPDGERVKYLITDTLPFEAIVGDKPCVLFLDELDRTTLEVQNALLQIIYDRSLDGHKLGKNVLIAAAGNGSSDIGTTPISRAAANRMCHIYVEASSKGASKAWNEWAKTHEVSREMIGYSDFAPLEDDSKYDEHAYRTRRSMVNADKIYRGLKEVEFQSSDIELALIAGCIGMEDGRKFLVYAKETCKVPTIEEIFADPIGCRVPTEISSLNALSDMLASAIFSEGGDTSLDNAVRTYTSRWLSEPRAYFEKLLERNREKISL
jgi:hypothetical protein